MPSICNGARVKRLHQCVWPLAFSLDDTDWMFLHDWYPTLNESSPPYCCCYLDLSINGPGLYLGRMSLWSYPVGDSFAMIDHNSDVEVAKRILLLFWEMFHRAKRKERYLEISESVAIQCDTGNRKTMCYPKENS